MDRRALGKGLQALIPEEVQALFTGELRMIPVDQVRPNPYQPRTNPTEDLSELVASIREQGVLQPLVVRRHNGYELVVGGRRLEAARQAGLKEVPAVVREVSESELLELALVENLQRADLNPIEEALAYRRLSQEFGMTHETIAQRVGKARSVITNALRLLSLPSKIRDYIVEGKITSGHARALLALSSQRDMERLCERIVAEGLSVREVERAARCRSAKERLPLESQFAGIEDELTEILGTRVRVRSKGSGGRIEIEFYSAEDLDRIIARLRR
jgi:ParB family chromosome partitioning protein